MSSGQRSTAETLRRAYETIQRLQSRLDSCEQARREPVAVIGTGLRFPGGAVDADSYWTVLTGGSDVLRGVPPDRWDVEEYYDARAATPGSTSARIGGFLDHADRFDHDFFGLSRSEAEAMDPQQRLTLEVTWEALEGAGLPPTALAGSRTGVYAAVCTNDFAVTRFRDRFDITSSALAGTAHSAVPGMVSHVLDLRGPSVALDTACSSSLVALHLAAQSVRSGECDLAVAGGVNVVISPLTSIAFAQAGFLSRQGRSRPFDAAADGLVTGEGCGFVVLQRLSDARRDGRRVLAVLHGSAVNHNGRGSALTAPNVTAQRDVLRAALHAGGIRPDEVDYVEAHGSSTPLGDVIESEALAEVYGGTDRSPLVLGSVKDTVGHLQAAGGVAGLIKVILCLDHARIPGNNRLTAVNPDIDLVGTGLAVPTGGTPWPAGAGRRRVAAVSTFGFTGTNAHVIVGEPPPLSDVDPPSGHCPVSVLALSAKTPAALLAAAGRYVDRLLRDDAAPLADICRSANIGRAHFAHRLAVVAGSRMEAAGLLRDVVDNRSPVPAVLRGRAATNDVVMLLGTLDLTGAATALRVFSDQPVFRSVLETVDPILEPMLGHSIVTGPAAVDGVVSTGAAEPVLVAVEYAAARMWQSWGVSPAAVAGRSVGEYVAACLAGVLDPTDALRLAAEHTRPERLRAAAQDVGCRPPTIPWVSEVTGDVWPWQEAPGPGHWARHRTGPGRWLQARTVLGDLGCRLQLEVGSLPPASATDAPASTRTTTGSGGVVPGLGAGGDPWRTVLTGLARLYVHGVGVDWAGVEAGRPGRLVDVPTYPFESVALGLGHPAPADVG